MKSQALYLSRELFKRDLILLNRFMERGHLGLTDTTAMSGNGYGLSSVKGCRFRTRTDTVIYLRKRCVWCLLGLIDYCQPFTVVCALECTLKDDSLACLSFEPFMNRNLRIKAHLLSGKVPVRIAGRPCYRHRVLSTFL